MGEVVLVVGGALLAIVGLMLAIGFWPVTLIVLGVLAVLWGIGKSR